MYSLDTMEPSLEKKRPCSWEKETVTISSGKGSANLGHTASHLCKKKNKLALKLVYVPPHLTGLVVTYDTIACSLRTESTLWVRPRLMT